VREEIRVLYKFVYQNELTIRFQHEEIYDKLVV